MVLKILYVILFIVFVLSFATAPVALLIAFGCKDGQLIAGVAILGNVTGFIGLNLWIKIDKHLKHWVTFG